MSTIVGSIFDDCSTLDVEDNELALAGIGLGVTFDNMFGTTGKLDDTTQNDLYEVDGEHTIKGSAGVDLVCGSVDIDLSNGVEHAILTGSDDLNIDGTSGANVLVGNEGNNDIDGHSGNDTLLGGDGNDTLNGGSGADVVSGGEGDDEIDGGSGADYILGGEGNDHIEAGSGADTINAGAGDDTVEAGSGADYIEGGDGNDVIDGESGADTIIGGAGDDTMTGSSGTDIFSFEDGSGNDVITDFGHGEDQIGIMSGINGSSITDTSDVMSHISTNAFGDAVIDLGGGNTITLEGVDEADLDVSDFFIFS